MMRLQKSVEEYRDIITKLKDLNGGTLNDESGYGTILLKGAIVRPNNAIIVSNSESKEVENPKNLAWFKHVDFAWLPRLDIKPLVIEDE